MKTIFTITKFRLYFILIFGFLFINANSQAQWSLSGNALSSGSSFLGTTNAYDLLFKANGNQIMALKYNTERLEINSNVGGVKLDVFGDNYPGIQLRSTGNYTSKLFMGVATCSACYSLLANPGDVVLAADGTATGNFIISARTNDDIIFANGNYQGETDQMRIISDGKIKMGTISTSGNYKLFVETGITTDKVQTSKVLSSDNGAIVFAPIVSGTETPAMRLLNNGKVVIGNVSTPGDYRLYVDGGILTKHVKVADPTSSFWADYVFEEDYNLLPLKKLEAFILENKHLPEMPSSEELYKSDGVDLLEMIKLQQQKIEELTLYIIELNKKIDSVKN